MMVLGVLTPRYADWCCLADSGRHNHTDRVFSPHSNGWVSGNSQTGRPLLSVSILTADEKGSW
jgi:hypothetical protein